jgi:ribonuclease HII
MSCWLCRAEVDSQTIDSINILQASLRAMAAAAGQLPAGAAHYYLVDGTHVPKDLGAPAGQWYLPHVSPLYIKSIQSSQSVILSHWPAAEHCMQQNAQEVAARSLAHYTYQFMAVKSDCSQAGAAERLSESVPRLLAQRRW